MGTVGGSSREKLESRPRCHLAVWSAAPAQLPFSVYKADLRLVMEKRKMKHTGASEQSGSWGGR